MRLRPCLDCGRPSSSTRCPVHTRPTPYGHSYRRNRALLLSLTTVCWICGKPGADTADHVVPVSQGGTSALTNLRPAHLSCNSGRGNRG